MIPDVWWTNYQRHDESRCEVVNCLRNATHVLTSSKESMCMCEFHIGKFAFIAMQLESDGSKVSVHKIGNVEAQL